MITEENLRNIPLPEKTDTYEPVGHNQLITHIRETGIKTFGTPETDMTLATNKAGTQLFGTMSFPIENGPVLAVGFRNSYDKSLTVGLCTGLQVMVCSNLCFRGDITTSRMHTGDVLNDVEVITYETFSVAKANYSILSEEISLFKKEKIDNQFGGALLGQMFVNEDILNTVQMNIAKEQWLKPAHEEFKPRTAWSLYNACTQALKKGSVHDTMKRYIALHDFFATRVDGPESN